MAFFLLAGLYQSLRHNYFVHQHDMDAAITSICQETLPLEVDMTSFLLSSCGHMQKLVSQARKELTVAKEVDLGRKHSVRFLEVVEIQRWVDVTESHFAFVCLRTGNHERQAFCQKKMNRKIIECLIKKGYCTYKLQKC